MVSVATPPRRLARLMAPITLLLPLASGCGPKPGWPVQELPDAGLPRLSEAELADCETRLRAELGLSDAVARPAEEAHRADAKASRAVRFNFRLQPERLRHAEQSPLFPGRSRPRAVAPVMEDLLRKGHIFKDSVDASHGSCLQAG